MKQTVLTCLVTDVSDLPNDTFKDIVACGHLASELDALLTDSGLTTFGGATQAAVAAGQTNTIQITIVGRRLDDLDAYRNLIDTFVTGHEWSDRATVSDFHIETSAGTGFDDSFILVHAIPRTEEPVPVLTRAQLDAVVAQSTSVTVMPAGQLTIGNVCIPCQLPAGVNDHIADDKTPCYVTAVRDRHVRLTYNLVISGQPYTVATWVHITAPVRTFTTKPTT
jgi:hypothetical protein